MMTRGKYQRVSAMGSGMTRSGWGCERHLPQVLTRELMDDVGG